MESGLYGRGMTFHEQVRGREEEAEMANPRGLSCLGSALSHQELSLDLQSQVTSHNISLGLDFL